MTACVNRKHTKKVAAVVTASLVGALSLGAAPVAAMADTGIDLQFVQPDGAFKDAQIVSVSWTRGLSDVDGDGVYEVTFAKNQPVALSELKLTTYYAGVTADLTIDAQDEDYTIAYYERDEEGNPTGDAITSDVTEVGKYVAVVTAVDGPYKGGQYYVRFDIDAIQLNNIVVKDSTVTYNAETHTFDFAIDDDGMPGYSTGDTKLYPGDDYDVEYIRTGHDATTSTEVKDAGTYKAKITGKGGYAGTVELSALITVNQLDLSENDYADNLPSSARIIGLTSSASSIEPKNLFAIVIDGEVYSGDDPIMGELKADLTDSTAIWSDNDVYEYTVSEKGDNPSIVNSTTFDATKVSYDLAISYGKSPLADSYDVFADGSVKWDESKLSGHAADGTKDGVDKPASAFTVTYINEAGEKVTDYEVNNIPGTYTVVVEYIDNAALGHKVGGVDFATIHTYEKAVNADATAAVLFDADGAGSGRPVVVSSINTTYDGTDWTNFINVVVKDSDGNDVSFDCDVKYYNAEGKEVGKIVNAGTYTLKVTSDLYKLSGTTEMTITIGKLDASTVKADALEPVKFDRTDNINFYLPWREDGYAISDSATLPGLDLFYEDVNGNWQPLPMEIFKVTITDSEGNVVEKIVDEGAYTIHFEARNADAANNYVTPADMTVHCIKDGTNDSRVDHLLFSDVSYTDYFADAVSAVNSRDFMNGYSDTKLFGSYDQLTRGQVACILYNMATYSRQVDESKLVYNELVGYETGFGDVNGKAYYGKAIAWAKQSGVVNGYGDGTFRPDAPVTREEFCAMIANYASKYDQSYEDVADTSALKAFDDASGVSEWAEEVVAWGIENGILGNGGFLNAQGDIIRADAACMVYNYAFNL